MPASKAGPERPVLKQSNRKTNMTCNENVMNIALFVLDLSSCGQERWGREGEVGRRKEWVEHLEAHVGF